MKKILEASICLIITTGIICGQELVGIDIDYEVLGPNGGMLMVTASGTAVKFG